MTGRTTGALLADAAERLRGDAKTATLADVTVGDRQVMVTVEHREHGALAGIAHRPTGDAPPTEDATVPDLVAMATRPGDDTDRLGRAIGIATLNALAVPDIDWTPGDPMADLPTDVGVVGMVGLFRPAFRKFDDQKIRVIEREPRQSLDLPEDAQVSVHRPAVASTALADADICFVTGSTLIYGGLGEYLSTLREGNAAVVLVGATASLPPDPFFDAGVDVLAGARVDDVASVRRGIRAGDCGTDLHDRGLTKVYVERPERTTTPDQGKSTRLNAMATGGPDG